MPASHLYRMGVLGRMKQPTQKKNNFNLERKHVFHLCPYYIIRYSRQVWWLYIITSLKNDYNYKAKRQFLSSNARSRNFIVLHQIIPLLSPIYDNSRNTSDRNEKHYVNSITKSAVVISSNVISMVGHASRTQIALCFRRIGPFFKKQ